MVDKSSISDLQEEFDDNAKSFIQYHEDMTLYKEYYDTSAFYAPKKGNIKDQTRLSINLLKVFADKNIHYTSPFPKIKTVPTSTDEIARQFADIREKVVHATHRQSGTPLLQKKWAFDGTNFSAAISETYFDIANRCVRVRRIDPRYAYWQYANENDMDVNVFWKAYPMTATQLKRKYGIDKVEGEPANPYEYGFADYFRYDGEDRYLVICRYDDTSRVAWVGKQFVEQAHNHQMGILPIDIALPFQNGDLERRGDFYLRQLVAPQAEFNETLRRRANIVRKLGNPAVWGRGIVSKQFEEVKKALKGDGGFVGLKANGELGILSIPETKMIDNHLQEIYGHMQKLSGFGNASFGESVGANTSGDALSLYFTPTTKSIEDQNVAWTAFYEGINAKILRLYQKFLKTGETKKLSGYIPQGTMLGAVLNTDTGENEAKYGQGGFEVEFTKDMITDYNTIVTTASATPKDEIAYKRLIMEAVSAGFISRVTGYEEFGLLSPEDELQLLRREQSDPAINPEGTSQLMSAANGMQEPAMAGMAQDPSMMGLPDELPEQPLGG